MSISVVYPSSSYWKKDSATFSGTEYKKQPHFHSELFVLSSILYEHFLMSHEVHHFEAACQLCTLVHLSTKYRKKEQKIIFF